MFLVLFSAVCATAGTMDCDRCLARATEFKRLKIGELESYADNQWSLLVEHSFAGRPDMVEAAQMAVELYAKAITLSPTERIFALGSDGSVVMYAGPVSLLDAERDALMQVLRVGTPRLQNAVIGGERRVFMSFYFVPFDWHVFISECYDVFHRCMAPTLWCNLRRRMRHSPGLEYRDEHRRLFVGLFGFFPVSGYGVKARRIPDFAWRFFAFPCFPDEDWRVILSVL